MRSLVLWVVASACSHGVERPPTPSNVARPHTIRQLSTDEEAITEWQRIAPTWATWREQRRTVPYAFERPLARALLRGGNFACPARKPRTCGPAEMGEPKPEGGFDDPCMRRVLATWALRMLSEDEIAALGDDVLARLVALPAPERRINAAVIDRVAIAAPDKLFPLLMVAGRSDAFDPARFSMEVDKLPAEQWQLAKTAHLYKGLFAVDPIADLDSLLDEMANSRVNSTDRGWAIERAIEATPRGTQLPAGLREVLVKLVDDRECDVAMSARLALAEHAEPSFLPQRPTTRDVAANLRTLCLASARVVSGIADVDVKRQREAAIVAAYHGPRELVVDSGDRYERYTRAHPIEIDDRIHGLIQACTGGRCDDGLYTAAFTFVPASDGGVWLERIVTRVSPELCSPYETHDFDDADFDREAL